MSVVGLGQSIVGHVRSKTFTAVGAVMLRVNEMDVTGPVSNQISNVVQNPGDDIVPPSGTFMECTNYAAIGKPY
jgi:hypothetical protein